MQAAHRRTYNRISWVVFLLAAGGGFYLESVYREMFFSKLLIFGSLAVWAWQMSRPMRLLHLGMVMLLCGMVIYSKYHFRHQRLIPLGHGAYLVKNQ